MPECQVNGIRIHYQQSGEGPDVVLIHAVTSNLSIWMFTGLVEVLARSFRVTVYDLRGHGFSECPASGYTSADMVADFLALHDALRLRPAVLLGHSFGGVVAVHAAVEDPQRVRGVILSDTFFPGLRRIEPNFGQANVWGDLRQTYRDVGVELPAHVDFQGLFQATAALSPEQYQQLEARVGMIGRGWLRQLPRLAATSCGTDVLQESGLTAARIAAVPCPLVALYDEFSPFLATYHWLCENIPRCQGEIIPGAKHLAMIENTPAFVTAVQRALTWIGGSK